MAVAYCNVPQVVDKLTDVAYGYSTITAGHRLSDKLINGDTVSFFFTQLLAHLILNRNNTNLIITAGVHKSQFVRLNDFLRQN